MTARTENGFMVTKYHLPNCKSSSGPTALIRNKLGFDDGFKWNKLCKMRTELIKSHFHGIDMIHINLNLVENKNRVDEVADFLRAEFDYPRDTKPEFQKLVIMAIQSIRRNLIRAQTNKSNQQKERPQQVHDQSPPNQIKSLSHNKKLDDDTSLLSLIIKDIIDDVIPLNGQSQKEQSLGNGLPDLNMFISDSTLLPTVSLEPSSIQKSSQLLSIPFFLKEKLLNNVQKSRTCYQLSIFNKSDILIEYQNLISLGETAINLTNRYIFERFYPNSNSNVIDFILKQTTKKTFLSQLSLQLFQSSTTIKLSRNIASETNTLISLLHIILGSLIKDFGFDPILYDISEILYHLIMMRYPHLSKNDSNSKNYKISSRESSVVDTLAPIKSGSESTIDKNILITTLSINPQIANKEVYKQVQISYQSKMQDFNFPLLSNATPSIKEIVNNCKQLFKIKMDLDLNVYYNNETIKTDIKLANLFNDLSIKVLHLELR